MVVPVVYTVTVAMTMAILMPPVWSWCIFWKPCIKPCYRSNGSKSKGAIGQVIHGSLHIDSLICYLLHLVYHYISYVYPSNTTVYPVYPYISSVPMFTLVILYTPIYPVYPCLPKKYCIPCTPWYILCTHVYPSNTVYLVYPYLPCLPMFTLVTLYTLYTPIYLLYPFLP